MQYQPDYFIDPVYLEMLSTPVLDECGCTFEEKVLKEII